MAFLAPFAGAIAAGATVVGVGLQMQSTNLQKRAAAEQKRLETLNYRRQQRQKIREAQIARAQGLQTSAGMGGSEGSGIMGGMSALASQLGSGLGFASQATAIGQNITDLNQRAANAMSWANIMGDVSKMAGGFKQSKPVTIDQPNYLPTPAPSSTSSNPYGGSAY